MSLFDSYRFFGAVQSLAASKLCVPRGLRQNYRLSGGADLDWGGRCNVASYRLTRLEGGADLDWGGRCNVARLQGHITTGGADLDWGGRCNG